MIEQRTFRGGTMENKYKPGDTVYIVSSVRWSREAKVLKCAGGFYTLKFTDTGGGIKVRESRIFSTKEAAEISVKK